MGTNTKKLDNFFSVRHEHYCTDRYAMGETIVKAETPEEAMTKLNDYLKTEPHGAYTPLPCKSIKDVYPLSYLA